MPTETKETEAPKTTAKKTKKKSKARKKRKKAASAADSDAAVAESDAPSDAKAAAAKEPASKAEKASDTAEASAPADDKPKKKKTVRRRKRIKPATRDNDEADAGDDPAAALVSAKAEVKPSGNDTNKDNMENDPIDKSGAQGAQSRGDRKPDSEASDKPSTTNKDNDARNTIRPEPKSPDKPREESERSGGRRKRAKRRGRGGKDARDAGDRKESRDESRDGKRDRSDGNRDRTSPDRNRGGGQGAKAKDARGGKAKPADTGKRSMLINVSGGDECRIAIVHNAKLEELFIERASSQSHVGNIYKGRVMNVEPSIQAAFVDFGLQKNGFLHISDVQPQYFPNYKGEPEDVGRKIPRRNRPPIQECFQRGQEVIVQVIKEGVGTKGPTLTTYLSIPGRFLVMMPGMSRHGVSRKIEDEDTRRSMRSLLSEMKLPPGIGFILRTAGMGQSKRELQRDLNYLIRLWKNVVAIVKREDAPAELYKESDLVTRTIRDVYSSDFERIVVDDAEAARRATEFLQIAMPRSKVEIEIHNSREPLFHHYDIENEIDNLSKRQVPLPSGGSLVIDTTEALVAIDVNSGKFRTPEDAEEMAYQLNLEAADEIARQLRLRDLGGLIVCDFIDMRMDRHKRTVERRLRDALKNHKERAKVLRMSAFGLIELTRQRRGPSMKRNTYFECHHCKGTGLVKMPESVVLDCMRAMNLAAHHDRVAAITVVTSSEVAYQILNRKRVALTALQEETRREITVRGDSTFSSDQVEYICEDSRGQILPFDPATGLVSGR